MFDGFKQKFTVDFLSAPRANRAVVNSSRMSQELNELLETFGGMSFNNGLYRVVSAETMPMALGFIKAAFQSYAGRAIPFGYDWAGTIFAVDLTRNAPSGGSSILLLEPGKGTNLIVPCDLIEFHEVELCEHADEVLASKQFDRWLERGEAAPNVLQCVGYQKPSFLGGEDTFENLKIGSLDVYWTLFGQLIEKVRNLKPGQKVGNISIK